MNETYIKRLIRLVEESEIDSLEVSNWWGRKIKITRSSGQAANGHSNGHGNGNGNGHNPIVQTVVAAPAGQSAVAPSAAGNPPVVAAPPVENAKLVEIKSPMVGTFYAAPAPDAAAYVSLNEKIMAGQVVCIVEAMKLMNEIESEVSGRVARICIENGQPVEFGQVLFLIDPA